MPVTVLIAFLLCALLAPAAVSAGPRDQPVGLELVLAVDASASITPGALHFQVRGHASAFRDPDVIAAASWNGIAATLAVFSGPHSFHVLVPWTLISSPAEAEGFAARVLATPPPARADATALGSAIADAIPLFERNGFEAPRQVIDIVSNGFNNAGPDPAPMRDRAVRRGITVNALAILDEYSWLDSYYAESVIGGPDAFVKVAADPESFVEALRQKLLQEIAGIDGPWRFAAR